MRSAPLLVIAVIAALTVQSAALAQTADLHATAEEQFKQGRELMNQGDCRKALALFQTSHAAEPGRGKLLNMAICEEQLGMLAPALRHFQELLPQLPANDERLSIARQHIQKLDKKVARVKVALAPWAAKEARVTLDDVALDASKLDADVPVDPGKHVVSVAQQGRSTRRYEVTVEPAGRASIVVEPGDSIAPAGVVAPPPPNDPSNANDPLNGKQIGGIAALSAGALGLGIGAVTGALALVKHQHAEELCPSHTGCSAEVLSDARAGKALSIASTVTLVAGALGAGTGAILLIMGRRSKASARAVVIPAPLHGGGWISVHGSF